MEPTQELIDEIFRERVLRARQMPPENVIVTKIRWAENQHRTKDREDAREVIAVQESKLDWTYIYRWADEHRTRDLLDRLRQSVV